MDTKQLVDKFISGEITEAEFDTETSKLTPEEQKTLKAEAEAKLPDAVEKLKGVRRGIDSISEKNKEKDATLATKMQMENLEAAKTKFFTEYGLDKEEDQKSFQDGFKTDSINVENIIKDMKTHYVAKNADKYLALEKEKRTREKEAEEYNANNANGGGSGGSGGDLSKVSKEVKDFVEATRKLGRVITPEQAEKMLKIRNNRGIIG